MTEPSLRGTTVCGFKLASALKPGTYHLTAIYAADWPWPSGAEELSTIYRVSTLLMRGIKY